MNKPIPSGYLAPAHGLTTSGKNAQDFEWFLNKWKCGHAPRLKKCLSSIHMFLLTAKRNVNWFIRIPFAITFAGHGAGKLLMPAASAEMLGLPLLLSLLVGVGEVLAGIGAIAGGVRGMPQRVLVNRLTGLAAAPILVGAIAMVHWPRWSFVATADFPFGGMEFQVLLLGVALYLLFRPDA